MKRPKPKPYIPLNNVQLAISNRFDNNPFLLFDLSHICLLPEEESVEEFRKTKAGKRDQISVEWLDFDMLKELMGEEPVSFSVINDMLKDGNGNEISDNQKLQELVVQDRPLIKRVGKRKARQSAEDDVDEDDEGDSGVISLEIVSTVRTWLDG